MREKVRERERQRRNKMSVNVDCPDIISVKAETFFAVPKRRLDKYFPVLNSHLLFAGSPSQLNKILREHFCGRLPPRYIDINIGAQLASLIILREKYRGRRTCANYAVREKKKKKLSHVTSTNEVGLSEHPPFPASALVIYNRKRQRSNRKIKYRNVSLNAK